MILKYISHTGQEYDLKTKGGLRARSLTAHTYEWSPNVTSQQYGDKVNRFDKKSVKYKLKLDVAGTIEERKAQLNALHAAFESDIFAMSPGKLVHGDYYVQCYMSKSETQYSKPDTENNIEVYCPYPFWIKENIFSFYKIEETASDPYLDYAFDFDYDFKPLRGGQRTIQNPGAGSANYKLIVYGPATNPIIAIDGKQIGATVTVSANEYIEIDSRENTIFQYQQDGTKISQYNNRLKGDASIFEKISPGQHSVTWSGTFGFDIIVFEERSEPAWS